MNAIVEAARTQNLETAKRLLEGGADVNAKDSNSNTALIWAVANTQPAMVRLLLENGADYETVTTSGYSPLSLAQRDGKTELIRLMEEVIPRPRTAKEEWKKMGAATVAHVGIYPEIKKKITTIFNFKSRDRIVLSKDLIGGPEVMGPATPFDAIAEAAIVEAYDQFTKLGGTADRDFVLSGTASLDKPKMRLKP